MGIKTGFTLHLLMVSDIVQPYIYGCFVEMTSIFLLTGQVILFNHQADVFFVFFGLPFFKMVIFHGELLNNQMVGLMEYHWGVARYQWDVMIQLTSS